MPPRDSELGLWFSTQVQPHERFLRAWLRGRFREEGDVDDIVQDAYIRLLRAHEKEGVASPKAFLFAVARNLALDRQRRRVVAEGGTYADDDGSAAPDESADVREMVAHNQELELLTEAIQALPDRCRQIFTLRKVYGLSQAEIAERLGVSPNTVSAQLTIGVKKCMEFMLQTRREREGRWP